MGSPTFQSYSSALALGASLWLAAIVGSQAQNNWTNTGVGYWNDPLNWSGGAVPSGGQANVSGGTAFVTNNVPNVAEAWAGNNGVAGTVIVTNGGVLNVDGWLVAGRYGGGGNTPLSTIMVTDGGTINKTGSGFIIGDDANCQGQVIVSGTGKILLSNGGWNQIGLGWNGINKGYVYLRDNALFDTPGFDFNIADWGEAVGRCYIQDNATLHASRFWIGKWDATVGALWQTGGAIVGDGPAANEWALGGEGSGSPNAFGFYNLAAGTLNCPFNFQVGRYGKGVMYQSGGTNTQAGWCDTARYGGSMGVFWLSGGLLQHTGLGTRYMVGENGRGEVTISGTGVLDTAAPLMMANGSAYLTLRGGTLQVPEIGKWSGQAYINFMGGTLKAKASNPNFFSATMTEVRVYPGNAIFDTAGYDITIPQALVDGAGQGIMSIPVASGGAGYVAPPIVQVTGDGVGALALAQIDPAAGTVTNIIVTCPGYAYTTPTVVLIGGGPTNMTPATLGTAVVGTVGSGGVVKNGAGSLTLSGFNTYAGPTVVNAGELITTPFSSGMGSYTVADGAGFGVKLPAAFTQLFVSSLTLGGPSGGNLSFDLGAFGNPLVAPLTVNGALTVNGPITVDVTDGLPQVGKFPLMSWTSKTGSGNFALGSLPPGVQATLQTDTTANTLYLNITFVGLPRWNGQAGGVWDIGLTADWTELSTGSTSYYLDGEAVLFDDAALGTTTVNLVTNVSPARVTFDNTNLTYTLVGTGKIGGAPSLVKTGTNSLTIANTLNEYTGPTIIQAGTVLVTNLANGGQPSAIGKSSSTSTNLTLAGGTLSYSGPAVTIDRGYSVQGAGSGLDLQSDLVLKGLVTSSGGSSFVKAGPAKLTYTGVGRSELSGGAFPGYNILAGTVVFDGSSGVQTNHSQSELWVGSTPDVAANLILSNTTLRVDSWVAVGRGNGSSGTQSTLTLNNSTLYSGSFSMGYANGLAGNMANPVITLNNSKFYNNGDFNLGENTGSTATLNLNGTSVLTTVGRLLPGMQTGATGIVMMADSAIITNNAWLSVGANGTGTLAMKNNTLFVEASDFNLGDYGTAGTVGYLTLQDNAQVFMTGGGSVYIGKSAGGLGYVTQTGGIFDARRAGVFQLAQSDQTVGSWLQSGGTTYAGGWVSIGRGFTSNNVTPTGLLVVSGGLFDQTSSGNGLIVGEQGTGTLTINTAGVVVSEANNIGVAIGWNLGVGVVNLDNGGKLVANFLQGGSGTSTFNFNGGLLQAGPGARLNFMGALTAANVLAGANIDTSSNNVAIAQPLLAGGAGGLTKTGAGTLFLNGANAYTGATLVNAGTLGGTGTIVSPVTIASGAGLAPGMSLGTLAISNSLTLSAGSTTTMEVNKNAGLNDQVVGVTTLTYGGTLVLKNLGGVLKVGDSLKLFSANTYSGSFASIVSQTPGQVVTWDTSTIGTDGTVKVATAVAAPTQLTPVVVGGTNLTLSWPATGWQLQVQTNPLSIGVSSNWVAVAGSTTTNQMTIPIDKTKGSVFYRLVFP